MSLTQSTVVIVVLASQTRSINEFEFDELEKNHLLGDSFQTWIIASLSCDPGKTGIDMCIVLTISSHTYILTLVFSSVQL